MSDEQDINLEDRGDVVADDQPEHQDPSPQAAEAEPPKPGREAFIPRDRFDEVNERLKEERQARQEERQARLDMEARLRALETPRAPAFDAKAAERAYLDAVEEGNRDKAAALWTQIREHERAQQSAHVTATLKAEMEHARAQVQMEVVAEALVEKYPFLDPASDAANPDAIKEVVEWRDYYIVAKKMTPAQALKQAVNRIAPNHAKAASATQQGITAGLALTQAQRLANAKAAAQLPPNTAQAGIGERAMRQEKIDVANMSDKEFSSLSDEERAKLRGDTVA